MNKEFRHKIRIFLTRKLFNRLCVKRYHFWNSGLLHIKPVYFIAAYASCVETCNFLLFGDKRSFLLPPFSSNLSCNFWDNIIAYDQKALSLNYWWLINHKWLWHLWNVNSNICDALKCVNVIEMVLIR